MSSTTVEAPVAEHPSSIVVEVLREHAWAVAVCTAMVAWVAALFLLVRGLYLNFQLARFDLGNMVQAVWSTTQGRPLEMTAHPSGEQMSRLGFHVDPILALLAPLWIVWPSPLALAFAQIVIASLGALPVFWLARRHLASEKLAALLAFAYLAYPWLSWTALDAVHPKTFAISLLLFCVWFLDTDRLLAFAVCAVLAAMTGELIAVSIAGLGIWYAVARGKRRAGLVIAVSGIAWACIAVLVVVPAFFGGSSVYYDFYAAIGGSPTGVIRTALTDPGAIASAAMESRDRAYVALLAAPLAGVFLLAPGLTIIVLPHLAANVLAGVPPTTDPRAPYVAALLPLLFAATIFGLARLPQIWRTCGVALVVTMSIATSALLGPWPGALGGTSAWFRSEATPQESRALRGAVSLVPDGAPVSSTQRVGAHLSARRYVYSVPVVGRAEWIVIDSSDTWLPRQIFGQHDSRALRAFHERIETSTQWRKVYEDRGVLVYRKVAA